MERYAFIMRGIPGSGKSTVAEYIADSYDSRPCNPNCAIIHSTDDLCMVDGEYKFDIELAGERHAQNLQNFKDSCASGTSCVIVDNTNVKTGQYQPYREAAEEHGYRVVIVELPHPDPQVAAQRNAHGVPLEVITQMIMDWEPAQHCVTVDKVNEAAEVVNRMRKAMKAAILIGFGGGAVFGALFYTVLVWLLT